MQTRHGDPPHMSRTLRSIVAVLLLVAAFGYRYLRDHASAAAPNTLSAGLQVGFIVCLLYSYFAFWYLIGYVIGACDCVAPYCGCR